jgi:hypothetical protein
MRSFGSEEELKAYLRKLAEERQRQQRRAESDSAAPPRQIRPQPQVWPKPASLVKTSQSPTRSTPASMKAESSSCTAIIWSC